MPKSNLNDTHDPNLKSWVESANDPATDFPIQNLPYVLFRPPSDTFPRTGVRIGEQILDLYELYRHGFFEAEAMDKDEDWAVQSPQFGPKLWLHTHGRSRARALLSRVLQKDSGSLRDDKELLRSTLMHVSEMAELDTPTIHNYTDFYASKHHAFNVGTMFRPDNALLPNYKHVPIAYHGRASSIVPSGTPIRRPSGQQAPPDDNPSAGPSFGPCKMLDYEMELGLIIGRGNSLGSPIPIDRAREHIFGMCIVNDWSARDLQKWEYQPLGPFLAKNFATTISPFIVTMEALEPFRIPGPSRDADDPQPLPYLRSTEDWGLDITVEVHLASKQMHDRGMSPVRLSKGNFKDMYWTIAQMVAHHASNGCNLQPGDLLASGTISGRETSSRGCLLEMTWQGLGPDKKPLPRKPISLPTGETRLFLQDGDEVTMKAYCEREGFRRIGFGECRGIIEPALAL